MGIIALDILTLFEDRFGRVVFVPAFYGPCEHSQKKREEGMGRHYSLLLLSLWT